jgi:hypothetical protein
MATSSAHEHPETRLITQQRNFPTHQQLDLSLKSNRFHPWIAAKRLHAKQSPNIASTPSPQQSTQHDEPKSNGEEQRNTAERIISHSINSIINGR